MPANILDPPPLPPKWRSSAGGGNFDPTTGFGHSSHTRWEDQTAVREAHHFFQGHEIAVTERLHLSADGTAIHYTLEARGPRGTPVRHEMNFEAG